MRTSLPFLCVILILTSCGPSKVQEKQLPHEMTNTTLPASSIPENWLIYHNDFLKYTFHYPQEAQIIEEGVTGFPSGEMPAGMDIGDYFDQLNTIYPSNLCVRLHLAGMFLSITPPDDRGRRYTGPCGISGIGNTYIIEQFDETIYLFGDDRSVTWTRFLDKTNGEWQNEASSLLINGFLIEFGVFSFVDIDKISEEEYLSSKPDLLLILASLEWTE